MKPRLRNTIPKRLKCKRLKCLTAITTAVLIVNSSAGYPAEAAQSSQEDFLRDCARRQVCRGLREGVLSGNLSPREAVLRLQAYDRACFIT